MIEVWGSSSEIVHEALPTDDPKQRGRTSHARASCSAGSRGLARRSSFDSAPLTDGTDRCLSASSRLRPLHHDRRALRAAASASRFLLVGLFDDTSFNYGNPDQVFPVLKQLRTQLVKVNLVWGGPNGVAKRRPVNPMNPNDPAYWWRSDRTVQYAQANGIKVVFSIIGTPPWANSAAGLNVAQEPSISSASRPPRLAVTTGRSKPLTAASSRPCAAGSLERTERPAFLRLQSAVLVARDPERDRLREDLQRDRQGHPEEHGRRLQGRVRRHRPAGQQQSKLEQAGSFAAAVPSRDEEGRSERL